MGTATNAPMVPTSGIAPLVHPIPPPPPPHREGVVRDVPLSKFLKLKPPTFAVEDLSEDPQRFLDGIKKACNALRCDPSLWTGFSTYQLQGKSHEWWITWQDCRAKDTLQVSYDEFHRVFIERFAPHMVPDKEEKICQFVLGLCLRLRQFVSM